MKIFSKIFLTIAIISFVITLGSCVGCYSATESPFSQYDNNHGDPEAERFFMSTFGLAILVFVIASFTSFFTANLNHDKQELDAKILNKMQMFFRGFATTALISAVVAIGSCFNYINSFPPPEVIDFQIYNEARENANIFIKVTTVSLLLFIVTLVVACKNYYFTPNKKKAIKEF